MANSSSSNHRLLYELKQIKNITHHYMMFIAKTILETGT